MRFEAETFITAYSPHKWVKKLQDFGFQFEKLGENCSLSSDEFYFKRKASLLIEFESVHQLINLIKDLGVKVKIIPDADKFKIVIGEK